ncbi:MAG TPA: hypothetical protein VE646_06290 [Actinomycetota bacterium]|jgi:folate-binding protein YgfZ|nr:hypothetical protein [Actinomycetota bacterium]
MDERTLEEQISALDDARALVAWSDLRLTSVVGTDARRWLHDLVTADIAGLEAFSVRRCLLLTPSGHIRADVHVYGMEDGTFVLAQSADQPAPVADLLEPYVLSSEVGLEPCPLGVLSVPGPWAVPAELPAIWSPSVLGDGFDVLGPGEELAAARRLLSEDRVEVSARAVEAWRILRGLPRFPVDVDQTSVPAEAGLDETVDTTKGCFLGQESVAKIRNLGHPPRVVLALHADGPVAPGATVDAAGERAGLVTSATPDGRGGTALLGRVRWERRQGALTASGLRLERV